MRPYDILFLIAGACISQPLAAQVAVTLTALTPITTTATEGLVTATNTQPAGPLANAYMEVSSTIPGTGTTARFESSAEVTTIAAYCSMGAGCSNNTASAVTSCNTVEVLANFTAAVPTRVRLAVEFDSALSPGATVPLAAVDVDNNGSLDYVNGTQTGFFQPRIIGPLGWQFRVILDADLWQPGQNLTNVRSCQGCTSSGCRRNRCCCRRSRRSRASCYRDPTSSWSPGPTAAWKSHCPRTFGL